MVPLEQTRQRLKGNMKTFIGSSQRLIAVIAIFVVVITIVFFIQSDDNHNPELPELSATLPSPDQEVTIFTITPDDQSNSIQQIDKTIGTQNNSTPTLVYTSPSPTVETSEPDLIPLNPKDWKNWPIIPSGVSNAMREIYQKGLLKGNNPHAYSILGDCNSEPDVFMGIYDHDSDIISRLDANLLETVENFKGSFDRYSPTVKVGTTEGALLWAGWNENELGFCKNNETPIDCEIRYHQPTISFINLGTHYESRHEDYLRIIIGKLLDNGTVPIIVTKADNREGDERINQTLANLAYEYELPLWNFWRSVQDVPGGGILDEDEMYLNDAALEIQREYGLLVLDFVFRELQKPLN